jgi:hypothetical protein
MHYVNYTVKYTVKYTVDHTYNPYSSKDGDYPDLDVEIAPVLKLFTTIKTGYDGWPSNNYSEKIVVIPVKKWQNIALIAPFEDNLYELVNNGARVS